MVGSLAAIRSAWSASRRAASCQPAIRTRLDQLQQSVDAIAVEVERIAEAQRFSAKLLAERGETPALPR
jgi:hypothetical protein